MKGNHRTLQISLFVTLVVSLVSGATNSMADDVDRLASEIDLLIAQPWSSEEVIPAPRADDAEFLRRVYLDVGGKIPPVSELRAFLDDTSPDKRRQLVDDLLETSLYITHFTNVWTAAMLPEAQADFQVRFLLPSFEAWMRQQFAEDVAYDEIVRQILTTPLNNSRNRNPYQQQGAPTPIAFYQAKQIKPENLAAATSRVFLGIRLECAQCHDHPFDHWKREEFWGFAAFFGGIQRQGRAGIFGAITELLEKREIAIPDTDKVVKVSFLNDDEVKFNPGKSARDTLANWITTRENPYFSRMAANRMWANFFGLGIVNPVDDFGADTPPSHPELLDMMADEFAAHNFDLKFLIRAITASEAYQRTSRQTHASQSVPERFARMATKGMTPNQLFASLAQATGYYEPFNARTRFAVGANNPRGQFLEMFSNDSDTPIEQQTTILQALSMMNGQFVTNATGLSQSQTLAAVVDYPLMENPERIETLYLSALSRTPRPDELKRLVKYVDSGGPKQDSKQALADVFWALLNSSEFMLNH